MPGRGVSHHWGLSPPPTSGVGVSPPRVTDPNALSGMGRRGSPGLQKMTDTPGTSAAICSVRGLSPPPTSGIGVSPPRVTDPNALPGMGRRGSPGSHKVTDTPGTPAALCSVRGLSPSPTSGAVVSPPRVTDPFALPGIGRRGSPGLQKVTDTPGTSAALCSVRGLTTPPTSGVGVTPSRVTDPFALPGMGRRGSPGLQKMTDTPGTSAALCSVRGPRKVTDTPGTPAAVCSVRGLSPPPTSGAVVSPPRVTDPNALPGMGRRGSSGLQKVTDTPGAPPLYAASGVCPQLPHLAPGSGPKGD
jgi:hypothetical protein